MLGLLAKPMNERHRGAEQVFLRRYAELKDKIGDVTPDHDEQVLIGAYFSQEYAFESAALFNPSIVHVPDQEPAADGSVPFLLSLRGIGEGHISSVTFRTGRWGPGDALVVDPPSAHGVPPRIDRTEDEWVRLECDDSQDVSETVIFPVLPSQRQGVEDLRLVNFTDDDDTQSIIGTYTAFDGKSVRQEMLRGIDLRTFQMRPLNGAMTGYKGMALFPRRINGQFVMLGRQDSENIWLLRSNDLDTWEEGAPIMAPKYPWEFVQLGNCGSPLEIDEGWLVFTHGVGLVRGYCIGACLLDKEDPSKGPGADPVAAAVSECGTAWGLRSQRHLQLWWASRGATRVAALCDRRRIYRFRSSQCRRSAERHGPRLTTAAARVAGRTPARAVPSSTGISAALGGRAQTLACREHVTFPT
jgi:hypothetical protein